jgi:alkylhydroperoxidase family enzyme
MARLPYLDKSDLAPEHQDLLNRPINLYRELVNSPNARRALSHIGHYIRYGSKLDPRLREMAILQVGYAERAPYEWAHHIKIGREFGVTDDDIRALIDSTEGRPTTLDEITEAVLQAAREMTLKPDLSDTTFAILQAYLDNERLVDLLVTIAFYNYTARIVAALKIDVEDEYLHYLDQFPLPTR